MAERDPYDFATFPRGDLSLRIGRRQVLLTAVTESKARDTHNSGGNTFRLSALGSMPDELLALITPRPVAGCELVEQEGFIAARLPGAKRPIRLFPSAGPAKSVYDRFNGQTMIEVIARELAVEQGWDVVRAFAYVRGVFLHLTTLGMCWPK